MAKRRSAQIRKCRAEFDGYTGWLFINETRHVGLTGFNWSFSTVHGVPYLSHTFDLPFDTEAAATDDAEDFGVEIKGDWLDNAPRRMAS